MLWRPVSRILQRYSEINGSLLAKGLAFSTLFAVVPLLFLLTIAGSYALTPEVMGILEREILRILPGTSGEALRDGLARFASRPGSLSLITVPLFFWTVHTLFFDIHRTVRAAFNRPVTSHTGRLRALGMNGAFLLLLYASALLSIAVQVAEPWLGWSPVLMQIIARGSSLFILTLVLWSLIRVSSGVKLTLRTSFPVALVSAIVWQGSSALFGMLVLSSGRRMVLYGVLAAAISVLTLTRIYAEILLYAAIWTAEIDPQYSTATELTGAQFPRSQKSL